MKILLKYKAEILVFLIVIFSLFIRLGDYPNIFDSCVEWAIHPQVNNVVDNVHYQNDGPTWAWTEMYQHVSGRSPIYSFLIESGLRLFGLSLLGTRFFTTILSFLSLILLYIFIKKYSNKQLGLLLILFLGTSPWYLIHARSGGIIGLSLNLVIIAISLTGLFLHKRANKKHSAIFAVLSAISIALLPYGHVITRVVPIFLILLIIFYFKRLPKLSIFVFVITLLLFISIQIPTWEQSVSNYFNARGESMINDLNPLKNPETEKFDIKEKLLSNTRLQIKYLLGLNDIQNFWDPNIAYSYWIIDEVLFPRSLVPFFLFGLYLSIRKLFTSKKTLQLFMLSVFVAGIIPGLFAKTGDPNPARDLLMVLPIYFFITQAIYLIYRNIKFRYKKTILLVFIIAVVIYQLNNFFFYPKHIYDDFKNTNYKIGYFIRDNNTYLKGKKILVEETKTFGDYSYVAMRWAGDKNFQKKLDSNELILLRNTNQEAVKKLIEKDYFDLIILEKINTLEETLKQKTNYSLSEKDNFKVYTKE